MRPAFRPLKRALPALRPEVRHCKELAAIITKARELDLESGLEKKQVQKPTHISAGDFVHWLAPESRIDDSSLQSLFKQ
jgi:hypothetical protein